MLKHPGVPIASHAQNVRRPITCPPQKSISGEQSGNVRRGAPLFGFETRQVNLLILLCQSVINGRKHFTHNRLQIWTQGQHKNTIVRTVQIADGGVFSAQHAPR